MTLINNLPAASALNGTEVLPGVQSGTTKKITAADIAALAGGGGGGTVLSTGITDSTSAGRAILTAVDAAAQRTSLGLGTAATQASTAFQAADAELSALAGLTSAANKFPYFTGSGTAALGDVTAFGRSLVDDADAATARATLGLVIGTDVQAQDAELAAIAGLTSAADRLAYFTGSGAASLATFTAAGRALVDDADASAQLTTLGVSTFIKTLLDDADAATAAATLSVSPVTRTINTQTGTTYTLVLADAGAWVTLSNASAITLTIPTNASVAFPLGAQIDLSQLGAGQVTVSPAGGVTMNSSGSKTKLTGQYSAGTLLKTATNTWLLVGDIAA